MQMNKTIFLNTNHCPDIHDNYKNQNLYISGKIIL